MSRVWDLLGGKVIALEGLSVVVHVELRSTHLIFSPSQVGEHHEDEYIFIKKGEMPYEVLPCDCSILNCVFLRRIRIPVKSIKVS